jgi:hypothetical protein
MTPEWTEDQWARIAPCPTCDARSGAPRVDGSTHPTRRALAGPIKAVTTTILNARRGICDCCGQPLP